ncbi:hypothetical protein F2Q70_00028316 [Brassica cretica]|uniref:Uncharacterized protein n=1 Tax=Brassica cretica TaxID=69181 RepID=A0A8S9LI13_BRACR|nr:hypothetical protein F2Q70_00028316 [Brassica cretica]
MEAPPPPYPPTKTRLGKQREDVYERYIQQQEEGKGLNRGPHEHLAISDVSISTMTHYFDESFLRTEEDYTGEIYYINWKNGMRVKEDPRKVMINADSESGESYGTLCSEEDSSYYDSEESSSASSPSSSENQKEDEDEDDEDEEEEDEGEEEDVLVVAGCTACFMYFMVPKLVENCPKCAAQLVHFDRPHSASS